MGRATYEVYATAWPESDGAYAEKINSMRKYVASTTIDNPAWHNTTVISDDLASTVAKLKETGGDILMHGFGPVARALMRHGLLDELHLWVHPHFAGVGTVDDMVFGQGNENKLDLLGTRTLASGIGALSYHVAAPAHA